MTFLKTSTSCCPGPVPVNLINMVCSFVVKFEPILGYILNLTVTSVHILLDSLSELFFRSHKAFMHVSIEMNRYHIKELESIGVFSCHLKTVVFWINNGSGSCLRRV